MIDEPASPYPPFTYAHTLNPLTRMVPTLYTTHYPSIQTLYIIIYSIPTGSAPSRLGRLINRLTVNSSRAFLFNLKPPGDLTGRIDQTTPYRRFILLSNRCDAWVPFLQASSNRTTFTTVAPLTVTQQPATTSLWGWNGARTRRPLSQRLMTLCMVVS